VKRTLEQAKRRRSHIIACTHWDDRQIHINAHHITHFLPAGVCTRIYFVSGDSVEVQQTFAEIHQLVNEVTREQQ
jgi:hypothetical protein